MSGGGSDRLSRRDLLRAGVGATFAAPLAGALGSAAVPAAAAAPAAVVAGAAGLFFSAAELALLDELTEIILPADEHSGGAREAGVATYLDGMLAETDARIEEQAAERESFKGGLALVDGMARAMHGVAFLDATPAQRLAVVERMAANESAPQSPAERFFVELKRATGWVYYSSRVGMIDDIQYQGNRVIREFVGADVSKR